MAADSGSSDQIMERYKASYDACYALYDKDKFAECIDQVEDLLIDSGLPRFLGIKLLILMAACMGDWWEEREVLEEADKLWKHVRSYHRQGDAEVDECLAELRRGIDYSQKQHRDAGCPKSSSVVAGCADPDGEGGSGDEESLEAADETLLATTDPDPVPGTEFAMGRNAAGNDVPGVIEFPQSATDVADAQSPLHAPSSAPMSATDTNRLSVLPLGGPKSTHSLHHISRMIGRCSWLSDQRLHEDEVDKDHFIYPWILFTGDKMGIATVKQQSVSDMGEIVGEWDKRKVYAIGSDVNRGSLVSTTV